MRTCATLAARDYPLGYDGWHDGAAGRRGRAGRFDAGGGELAAAAPRPLTYRDPVATASSYRFVWRPRWFAGHLLVLAAVVVMVLLGHWQLTVSDRKHFSLQNFGYALQWWAFSVFALGFWGKIVHDRARGVPSADPQPAEPAVVVDDPVAYRRYVMPTSAQSDDPELARYNAYLAALGGERTEDRP